METNAGQGQLYFERAREQHTQNESGNEERLYILSAHVDEEGYCVGICMGKEPHIREVIRKADKYFGHMRTGFVVAACRAVPQLEDEARRLQEQCSQRSSYSSPGLVDEWLGRNGTWFSTDDDGLDELIDEVAALERATIIVHLEYEVSQRLQNLANFYDQKLEAAGVFLPASDIMRELFQDMIRHFAEHMTRFEETQTRMSRDNPAAP